jgi:hypothetical protein
MTGIEFKEGDYGTCAVLTGKWSDQIGRVIQERQCPELEINHGKGWSESNLSFLPSFPWLKALWILDLTLKSVEPIHALTNLRALKVFTYCESEIRFSAFPHLERCSLEWRRKAESLFECTTLKKLFVNCYKGKSLASFSRLVNLESLGVLNAPLHSLDGIASLKKLRALRIANLTKLPSLAGLEALENLEELDIDTCRKIGAINEVADLKKLRKLFVNNCGDIESLKPISSLENLEVVLFWESTNILDGDLSYLKGREKLVDVAYRSRKHYSHKREEFPRRVPV